MFNGIFRQLFNPTPAINTPSRRETTNGAAFPDLAPTPSVSTSPGLPTASAVTTGDYRSSTGGDPAAQRFDVTAAGAGAGVGAGNALFQPASITALDMRVNPGPFGSVSHLQNGSPVVPGSTVHDPSEALRTEFASSRNALTRKTNETLQAQIEDPALRARGEQALAALREAMGNNQQGKQLEVSVNALLGNRQPPLSDEQLVSLLEKTQTMVGTQYDSRAGGSAELALSALQDIAVPSNINQRQEGTCMAGAAQMQIASLQPERYLDMIHTLGQNQSYPPGESPALLEPNWSFTGEQGAVAYRTPSVALIQNSIIDAMNGDRAGFNSAETAMSNGGTTPTDLQRLLPQLLGESGEKRHTRSAEDVLSANPSRENPIFVALAWSEKPADQRDDGQTHYYHALNLIGVDRERGQVTLMNPHGYEQSFSIEEFNRRFNQGLI